MPLSADKLYEYLANEEDARVCEGISEAACREVPGNFLAIFVSQCLTKIGDAITSAKIVIPWMLAGVGAPAFFAGMLVPIRESGSLLPQLLIGGYVRRHAVRKWFYVIGSVLQGLVVLLLAAVFLYLQGRTAGLAVVGLLVLFSLARGLCSVASKDVLGKCIAKTRRGLLSGYCASAAGLITIAVGAAVLLQTQPSSGELVWLLLVAALCWFIAAIAFARVKEFPGASDGGGNAVKKALASLSILRTDGDFRRFVITRSLLMSSGLASPYLILLVRQSNAGNSLLSLGVFVIAGGIASLIGGVTWGKLADRSSRKLLAGCALLVFFLCAAAGFIASQSDLDATPLLLLLFFLLSLTHDGIRLARKTYIVDMADGNRRTDYVAVSNTLIGVLLLLVGAAGALLAQLSLTVVLGFYGVSSLLAFVMSLRLPEA